MEYVKTELKNADKVRRLIVSLNLFDSSREVQHSRSYVYFPIVDIKDAKAKKPLDRLGAKIISKKEARKAKQVGYEEMLKKILSKKDLDSLARGYDQIGDIGLIEFDGPKSKEIGIAKALMRSNKSIKTVVAKQGAVYGKFRIRKVRYIAGKRNFIAEHRENGCIFRFDIRKVFFSNRLSYERSRILNLVKDGENVMVMFAGVGPFAIEIGKSRKKSNVIAIELNKYGYKYMKDNVELNKTRNVLAVLGDVKKLSRKYRNFADRIIMPLPKSSMEFLDDVYLIAKRKATVHLYVFANSDESNAVRKKIMIHAKKKGYKVNFLNQRTVRPYSSTESELALDYMISK